MAEISNELIYEVLKSLQRDAGETKLTMGEIKAELSAVRGYLVSLQQDVHDIYGIMGRHDLHLETIENRLELSDAPAS